MRVESQPASIDYYPAKVDPGRNTEEKAAPVAVQDKKAILADEKPVELEQIEAAVETVNDAVKMFNYHLEFKVHEASGRYQVKVVDSETSEVIREIPPENVLDMAANFKKMVSEAVGLMFDCTI